MESKKRSAVKSIAWRIFGVIVLAAVTYGYTKEWITTGLVTVIHHASFLFIFYFHERAWLKTTWGSTLQRSLCKMLTYETLLGNIVLGLITLAITGSWKDMGQITVTYIGIKHVMYVLNEFVWKKN